MLSLPLNISDESLKSSYVKSNWSSLSVTISSLTLFFNFMSLFYGWGSRLEPKLEPFREGSLLFTTNFPEIPVTNFIDLGRMTGWLDLGPTQWFWTGDPWIGNPSSALATRPLDTVESI